MEMKMYCIRDIKVNYRAPMLLHNDDEAKRALSFYVNSGDKTSELCLVPQDFELYCLGEYNDLTGEIRPAREFICNLAELKRSEVIVNDIKE